MTGSIPRRRRPQFGLKTLIIVIGVFGVLLGIWVAWFEPYRREAEVMEMIHSHHKDIGITVPDGPAWARAIFGDRSFRRLVKVSLGGNDVSDADLELLRQSPMIRSVTLHTTSRVTNAGLRHLASLPNLEELTLIGPQFSDASLEPIGRLRHLLSLHIINANLSNDGLRHLAPLAGLREAQLKCSLTDASLHHLPVLPSLLTLRLQSEHVSDKGLTALTRLPRLLELELVCVVTDAGMAHLHTLKKLERLECYREPRLERTVTALEEPTDIEFVNTPPEDVLEYLHHHHEVTFAFKDKLFETAGIDPYQVVTLSMHGPTFEEGLRTILDSLNCGWRLDSSTSSIFITTKAELDRSRPELNKLRQELPNLKTVIVDW
jgi:hypothetical protein